MLLGQVLDDLKKKQPSTKLRCALTSFITRLQYVSSCWLVSYPRSSAQSYLCNQMSKEIIAWFLQRNEKLDFSRKQHPAWSVDQRAKPANPGIPCGNSKEECSWLHLDSTFSPLWLTEKSWHSNSSQMVCSHRESALVRVSVFPLPIISWELFFFLMVETPPPMIIQEKRMKQTSLEHKLM